MITPMKKVTILCMDSEKQATLEALRSLGILHVTPLRTPSGASLNEAKSNTARIRKALDALPSKTPKGIAPAEVENPVEAVNELVQAKKVASDEISEMQTLLTRFGSFGNLDPETVKQLDERGVFIRLYEVAPSKTLKLEEGSDAKVFAFGSNNNGDLFAVFNLGTEPAAVSNATEMTLPAVSIAEMKAKLDAAKAEVERCDGALASLSSKRAAIKSEVTEAEDEQALQEAACGMIGGAGVSIIQGYCPAPRLAELEAAVKANGWGLKAEDPSDEDMVPTLLTHKPFAKPMEFLYSIIGISPGYREVDVSAVVLCFFSLFFAMIVGDAFYGLLFLAITIYARKKMPNASSSGFNFMYLMSVMTIIWGILNASYLGFPTEMKDGVAASWASYFDLVNYDFVPSKLKTVMLWLRDQDNTKYFCFILALIQLSIAHAWNVFIKIKKKSTVAFAQLGWLFMNWVMFCLAGFMVLNKPLPGFVLPLFIVALVLLVLFSVPPSRLKEEWVSLPMLVLNVVNSFVDVISYIRLFAVGMSGAAIAETFTEMLSPLFGSAVGIFVAAIVLLLVHALNIALAVMGVAVHAVRLNTLEFSNGLELQWSGFDFNPLKKRNCN